MYYTFFCAFCQGEFLFFVPRKSNYFSFRLLTAFSSIFLFVKFYTLLYFFQQKICFLSKIVVLYNHNICKSIITIKYRVLCKSFLCKGLPHGFQYSKGNYMETLFRVFVWFYFNRHSFHRLYARFFVHSALRRPQQRAYRILQGNSDEHRRRI